MPDDPSEILNTQEAPAPPGETALAAVPDEPEAKIPWYKKGGFAAPRQRVSTKDIDKAMEKYKDDPDRKRLAADDLGMGVFMLAGRIKNCRWLSAKWQNTKFVSEVEDEVKKISNQIKLDAVAVGRIADWVAIRKGTAEMIEALRKRIMTKICRPTFDETDKLQRLYLQLNDLYIKQGDLFIRIYRTLHPPPPKNREAVVAPKAKADFFERRRIRKEGHGNGEFQDETKRAKFAMAPKVVTR